MKRSILLAAALAGCGVAHPPQAPELTSVEVASQRTPPAAEAPAIQEATPAPAAGPSVLPTPSAGLQDPRIVAVVSAANDRGIEQARLALGRARNDQVKDFAQLVYDHRREARLRQRMLESSLGLIAEPTAASAQLATEGDQALASLTAQSPMLDFDRAYVAAQIREHKRLLDALDFDLIPAARDVELRKWLIDLRPTVAEDLRRALALDQILSK